jgi:hypothetical protein
VAAALVLTAASPALAFVHDVGTEGVGQFSRVGGITLGSLTTCDSMKFTGHVTSNDKTYGDLGGIFQVDTASWQNCTKGAKVTANLPLSFSVDPAGGYGVGFDINITTASGTCGYSSGLWGSGGFGGANVGGSVYQRSTGCGGPSQFDVRFDLRYAGTQGGEL